MSEPKDFIELAGLQTSNNTFSASPPGSMLVAQEAVMPQKGVVEPRRGQGRSATLPAANDFPFAMTEFQSTLIVQYGTSKTDTSQGLGKQVVDITAFGGGPYNPVDCNGSDVTYPRMKFGFAGGYLYFCTQAGPKALESVASDPRAAGLLRMPDATVRMLSPTTVPLGTGGAGLAYGDSRAYRTVLRVPTSDGVSLLSPPSGRVVVTNRILAPIAGMVRTGGTTVTVTIPGMAPLELGLAVGDTFTLTPGEANFAAGSYTVASVSGTPGVFTYADAGVNVANTIAQDFNTGPRAVRVGVNLSADATTSTPWRVYRSLDTSGSAITPSDELFLAQEAFPTAGQITAGLALFDDTVPASALNDPLYTNPQTGEGAKQENDAPPLYRDTANWGARQWYLNTTDLHEIELQMLGVGTPDGVQANDTITATYGATTITLTFKASASIATEVTIVSNAIPSVNVQHTTTNLVAALNLNFGTNSVPFRAYYNSAQDEAPGKILIQATSQAATALGIKASRPATWTPALDPTTAVNSVAERIPNGLSYAKLGQAEAVPYINRLVVGSKNYAAVRIIALQQALLIFKAGDGIYSLTGNFPFQVQQISTANIIAPDACALFADAAWVYTDQGILRVSDSGGASVVSRPIEVELNALRAALPNETHDWSFAVPYETERRIMFFVPVDFTTDGTDRPILQAFCYCNATQAWTGPLYVNTETISGVVLPSSNKLALGVNDVTWSTTRTTLERKAMTYLDYADASFSKTVTAHDVGGNPLIVELSSLLDVAAGDVVLLSTHMATKIAALRPDISATAVEVYEDLDWAAATTTVSILKHIDFEVQFQPQGSPSSRKTLTRLAWSFKPEWFETYAGKSLVMTDKVQDEDEIATTSTGFGLGPFGGVTFGNPTPLAVDVNPIDAAYTTAAQFFPGYSFSEAWVKFRLQGFMLTTETASGPSGRGK